MAKGSAALEVLADPTRRALVEALRGGPLAVGELVERVPVSQSAVSQHLKVLRDARLVEHEADGARRHYRLRPQALGELRAWVDALWDDALAGLAREAGGPPHARRRDGAGRKR